MTAATPSTSLTKVLSSTVATVGLSTVLWLGGPMGAANGARAISATVQTGGSSTAGFQPPEASGQFFGHGMNERLVAVATAAFKASCGAKIAPPQAYPPGLSEYLEQMVRANRFSEEHVRYVDSLWLTATRFVRGSLPPPLVQPTSEGALQLAWGNEAHYVEVDVFPDGAVAWFYKDLHDGDFTGTSDEPTQTWPDEMFEKIELATQRA